MRILNVTNPGCIVIEQKLGKTNGVFVVDSTTQVNIYNGTVSFTNYDTGDYKRLLGSVTDNDTIMKELDRFNKEIMKYNKKSFVQYMNDIYPDDWMELLRAIKNMIVGHPNVIRIWGDGSNGKSTFMQLLKPYTKTLPSDLKTVIELMDKDFKGRVFVLNEAADPVVEKLVDTIKGRLNCGIIIVSNNCSDDDNIREFKFPNHFNDTNFDVTKYQKNFDSHIRGFVA